MYTLYVCLKQLLSEIPKTNASNHYIKIKVRYFVR